MRGTAVCCTMVSRVVALWFSWCYVVSRVESCGISTHIDVGERIRHFLDLESQGVNYGDLIQKHPDAYQAGCPYPDAYYPSFCFNGDYHDVAEDTHWVPFLNASINYIRDTYPRPWNETGEKLVVFLLGIVAHQVADVNWHSLGIDQGYLTTMGYINYHGSYGDAHTAGDFGGDVVNLYELDMDYIPMVDTWYVPTQDLLNIYELLYGRPDKMLPEVVEECTNILFLGRLGEQLGVIEYLYPNYASQSPFLVDRLNDYFLGGMDDMAAWSGNVFKETAYMLDEGTHMCSLPENVIYIECNLPDTKHGKVRPKRDTFSQYGQNKLKNPGIKLAGIETVFSLVDEKDSEVEETDDGGLIFRPSRKYKRRLRKKMRKEKRRRDRRRNRTKFDDVITPDVYYSTQLRYSRLGETMLTGDVNNDGDLDLLVAAPGYGSPGNYQQGRVYVIYGSEFGLPSANLTLELDADLIFNGPRLNGRFGTSLALLDINADGYNDLVVGAPSVGSDTLDYNGQVYVYFGSALGTSAEPNVTITCTERYCNLGWSLTSGDVTHDGSDDLIIGAPFAPSGGQQRGFIGALHAGPHIIEEQLTELNFDWRWNGGQDYEWFGYSSTFVSTSDSTGMLTVGSPVYRLCTQPDCSYDQSDLQSVGQVSTFSTPLTSGPELVVAGNISMAQLGYHVASDSRAGQQMVAISASTRDFPDVDPSENSTAAEQLGHVSIYDWSDSMWQHYFSVVGDREFGRLGADVQFADVDGDSLSDVIMAAPLRSETIAEGREEGRVFIFLNDEAKRGQVLIANEADAVLGMNEDKARYGYSVATLRSSQGQLQVAASAPHSNRAGRLTGVVAIHDM